MPTFYRIQVQYYVAAQNLLQQEQQIYFKGPYLGSNLLSSKVSHQKKRLCKILFSNDIGFLSYVKLKFRWCLYATSCRRRTNEPFSHFLAATKADNLFDDPVLFKNVQKIFLTDTMMHNWNRRNQHNMNV